MRVLVFIVTFVSLFLYGMPVQASQAEAPGQKAGKYSRWFYPSQMSYGPIEDGTGNIGSAPSPGAFLTLPFMGPHYITSLFDHCYPNYTSDNRLCRYDGTTVSKSVGGIDPTFDAGFAQTPGKHDYLYYDGHNGYDYNLWYQPVYAAAPGKVIYAAFEYADAPDHGYGKMVMVDHAHGYITLYGHFSKLLVKPGQWVKRGQELGISGNTGHSSGPHLHFTVFHNCTPTDPYGWVGTDADPLTSYQGETSIYLWTRPPLVINPLPHWPGMYALPATSIERLLLLKLPSTGKGTHAFVSALRRETNRVLAALLGRDRGNTTGARADLLHGAVDVTAAVSPEQLYALPDAVSIASTDVADDARVDVLNALARAALVTPHRRLRLASSLWTGYLFQWDGRTFLVGEGAKGKQVHLRLARGKRSIVDVVKADPTSGAYAVDLGKLSKSQIASLRADLQGRHWTKSSLQVQPVQSENQRRTADVRPQSSSGGPGPGVIVALALCLLALLAAGFGAGGWLRRRATRWQ